MQQQKNYLAQTALGTLLVIISLFVLYLIPEFDIGNFHFKRINLLADIFTKDAKPHTDNEVIKKVKPVFVDTCKTGITCIEDYTADTSGMTDFFSALALSKKQPVRIAWFGDSYVEGDIMLDPLRDSLQAIFGGNGVGFVPVTSEVSRFRQTILHEFKNWKTLSSVGNKDKDAPLGPAGYTFIPLEGNTVTYRSVNKRHLNLLPGIKIFYGQCEDATIEFHVDGSEATRDSLKNGDYLQQYMLSSKCNEFDFRIPLAKKLAVYGVSFEDKTGISIDNFSMRGNSGIGLIETPETLYRQMDELHHYNLVVMSYGLNVASEKAKNYDWYIKSMNKVIKMMKHAFPHSSILLIGCSDRAQKINGDYETMPMLKELVDVQRQMAVDNQICFWNLFEAMGGDSTMVNWAGMEKHPLADKDYTHLTFRGGKKVAEILLGTFLYEKEKYDRKRKN